MLLKKTLSSHSLRLVKLTCLSIDAEFHIFYKDEGGKPYS